MISRTQMEKFVNEYLSTIDRQSTAVPRSYKILLFPSYLSTPARALALQHYRSIMENAVQTAPIQMLSGTLEAYEKLLEAANLAEQHLQTFLDNNPILIE